MTHSENVDKTQVPSPERIVSDNTIQELGHTGISENSYGIEAIPRVDIEVRAIGRAHYAPAGAQPYEGRAKKGVSIQGSSRQVEQAVGYASSLFPNSNFSFIGDGRYGVVLADETGKAFKLYRSALSYSRYEKEAGALKLLSDAGLAPKLHLFVDAGEEYRLDLKAYDYSRFGFGSVQIPRQDSGKELPVMIMDKVEVAPLESAEPEKFIEGFCKVADVFIEHNIHSWDAEVVVDKASGKIIILDVGELWQEPLDGGEETAQSNIRKGMEILHSLAADFGLGRYGHRIEAAYQKDGVGGVRKFLAQIL